MLLRPAHIHPQQHFRPVLRLRAAGAGMDLQETVIAIGLAGQQAFQFLTGYFLVQCCKRRFRFGQHLGVTFQFRQVDHLDLVAHAPVDIGNGADRPFEAIALPHDLLRLVRVVPELRRLRRCIQFLKAQFCRIEVKETSSAVPATARFDPPATAFPPASYFPLVQQAVPQAV